MKLLKPEWVNHEGNPIFAIDIHPDDTRFATGGQGNDSLGRIVIWNMVPILKQDAVRDDKIPKILCQMDHHNACVNCLRWSHSGLYLASGGDDKIIIIWKLASKSIGGPVNSAFGKTSYEQWKSVSTLVGHGGDVLDLSWSPGDKYLATASVDNTVIIWDAQDFPQRITVLKGHTSFVKGVTWDPVSKFLATQSDDKSLKIWKTYDWSLEADIKDPFIECGGTTTVLRLNWSPDGSYLVSAHAMNGGGPTAQIIDRSQWSIDKDFVGHRKAVVCVRFSPSPIEKEGDGQKFCMVALGSRDKSVSVWSTSLKRPVVVLNELFNNSVMDLSWSTSGRILLACSWDGSAAVAVFAEKEILGQPLSAEQTQKLIKKCYGNHIVNSETRVIQNVEVLLAMKRLAEEKSVENEAKSVVKSSPEKMDDSSDNVIKGPIDRQIETRTADGKRRITPKFIVPAHEELAIGDSPTKSTGVFEKSKEVNDGGANMRDKMVSGREEALLNDKDVSTSSKGGNEEQALREKTPVDQLPSEVTSEKNLENRDEVPTSSARANGITPEENERNARVLENGEATLEEVPRNKEKKLGRPRDPDKILKRKKGVDDEDIRIVTNPAKKIKSDSPRVPIEPESSIKASSSTPVTTTDENLLPPLSVKSVIMNRVSNGRFGHYVLEVENGAVVGNGTGYRLTCRHDPAFLNGLTWDMWTDAPICGLSGDSGRIVVICADETIHLFDLKGRYAFPPILLPAYPARYAHIGQFFCIVTVRADLKVFDVHGMKNVLPAPTISILPLLNRASAYTGKPAKLVQLSMIASGSPLVYISDGRTYVFDFNLVSWLMVQDHFGKVTSPMCLRFNDTKSGLPKILDAKRGKKDPLFLITYMKFELAVAQQLKKSEDVRQWLITLASTMAELDLKEELNVLCDDLLGPTHSTALLNTSWNPFCVGVSKRKVLRQILTSLIENLKWQDFYFEYDGRLKKVEAEVPPPFTSD